MGVEAEVDEGVADVVGEPDEMGDGEVGATHVLHVVGHREEHQRRDCADEARVEELEEQSHLQTSSAHSLTQLFIVYKAHQLGERANCWLFTNSHLAWGFVANRWLPIGEIPQTAY